MTNTAEQVAKMVDMLPDKEQVFALEFVKRLVLAWDVDFTKATPSEDASMQQGKAEIENGEFVRQDEIDWS